MKKYGLFENGEAKEFTSEEAQQILDGEKDYT
jgi:hypothetical protein